MNLTQIIADFFGGAVLANALPHLISGVTGRAFQTPFAKPPGQGLSSSIVNAVWGFANLIAAYLLLVQVGNFDLSAMSDVLAAGLGAFLMILFCAYHFGKFHGGKVMKT